AIFYSPALFASLIVLPIVALFWLFGKRWVALAGGIVGGIAMNYYFRSHLGYCDTDMVIFPLFYLLLFSLVATVRRGLLWSLLGVVAILLLLTLYHSAKPIVYGTLLFFSLYILVVERKNIDAYLGAIILFIAALPIGSLLAGVAALGAAVALHFLSRRVHLNPTILFATFLISALALGGYGWQKGYFKRVEDYLAKSSHFVLEDRSHKKIELEATLKTVSEARGITLPQLFLYSAGGWFLFLTGSLGLLLIVIRERGGGILLLPYLITLFALKGGVRFTTFGAPILAVATIYLSYWLFQRFKERRFAWILFLVPSVALFSYYIYIVQLYNKMLSPFFKRGELEVITEHLNTPTKGYILTWWDYGWPLWYYTNKRTLIDNGKHQWDTFIVARALFEKDQRFVANFSRFFIEQYDRIYPWAVLPYVAKRYSLSELLEKLKTSDLGVKRENEIYYYFDDRIITKLQVIEQFSSIKGEPKRGFVWIDHVRLIDGKRWLLKAQVASLNLKEGILEAQGRKVPIGMVIFHNGEKVVQALQYRKDPYTLIVYKNRYLIGTSGYLTSFFFRAFFFNRLDPRLFETVAYTKDAKVFRLKK
ncbi:MAG: hypothetical protein GXO19_07030, partial [Epsilonproteobacteria bacterium]|nr:hypothetical protein [Campylobacterota bacterium]NPA57467.1 hypothetical protein [Campylobacterota bacterium]